MRTELGQALHDVAVARLMARQARQTAISAFQGLMALGTLVLILGLLVAFLLR